MKNRSSIFRAIEIACLGAAMAGLPVLSALNNQQRQNNESISTIQSILDTERDAERISDEANEMIRHLLRPVQYPNLYGPWVLRNLSFMTSGLLMGSVLAGLLARKAKASSSSTDLEAPLFRKEEPSKSSSSDSSLKTEH